MFKDYSTGSYGPHAVGPQIDALRERVPDDEVGRKMAQLASAFSDPGRIKLLAAIADGSVCVGDLALTLSVSQSSISHQLRLLRTLGIVTSERRGRHICYSLAWPGAQRLLAELRRGVDTGEGRRQPAEAGENIKEDL